MNKPIVAVFSDSNFFSIYLVENLLSKICEAVIVAPDKNSWQNKISHIVNKGNLQVIEEKDFFKQRPPISYAVFCSGFINKVGGYQKFKYLYSSDVFKNIKSISIFPREIFDSDENGSLPINSNLAVIYLGDLLGPRIDLNYNLRISTLILEAIREREISLGVGEIFYPTFAPNAARQIVKWIFSFGPYGREVFMLGQEESAGSLWKQIERNIPGVRPIYNSKLLVRNIPRGYAREEVPTNTIIAVKETLQGLKITQNLVKTPRVAMSKLPRSLKIAAYTLAFVILFPLLTFLISSLALFLSYKSYLSGRVDISRSLLVVSSVSSKVGKAETGLMKVTPPFNWIYKEVDYALYLEDKLSEIGLNSIPTIETVKELTTKILGDEIYDPQNLATNLGPSSEYIYQNISFIEAETKTKVNQNLVLAGYITKRVDFERFKKLALSGVKISEELADILGKNERKTYLVLFQNNTELRPTGGFIGSFALVTFEGGRMTDFSVSDVYSADGQLKGHIEPPGPVKEYLGEASWFLRDSNWDPDFPTSAKRAEWFIDKEIDRQVDGVIAVDLGPARDILKHTGSIYLPDYQMDITSQNLYEKTQEEVHEDFFPGTHKKASFLTALSRNLITIIGDVDSAQKLGILKAVYENLETRHIQLYLHNEKIQKSFSDLGWSGEVDQYQCGQNCYGDFLGLVEANVGVNKANYFVSRDQSLVVTRQGGEIRRDLTITFINTANQGLGAAGKYKTYVRVLVPAGVRVEGNFDVAEERGLTEIGFLAEVLSGTSKSYTLRWTGADEEKRYGLYVRKQAGTEDSDKLSVAIDGEVVYNSNLTKDIWIQKP
jgi:hypothetical protein